MENLTAQESKFINSIGKEVVTLACKGCPESINCRQKENENSKSNYRGNIDICIKHWQQYLLEKFREANAIKSENEIKNEAKKIAGDIFGT